MIKFVCPSCNERLSVPDQHGGRKGVCPTCGSVNRIPLKGFAETKPQAPVIARPDGKLTGPPAPPINLPAARGAISPPALAPRLEVSEPSQKVARTPSPAPVPAAMDDLDVVFDDIAESKAHEVQNPPPSIGIANAGRSSLTGVVELPEPREVTEEIRPTYWGSSSSPSPSNGSPAPGTDYHQEAPPALPERRLPRPIKIVLLIFAVLAIVGGLYCALYYGIQALMRTLGG